MWACSAYVARSWQHQSYSRTILMLYPDRSRLSTHTHQSPLCPFVLACSRSPVVPTFMADTVHACACRCTARIIQSGRCHVQRSLCACSYVLASQIGTSATSLTVTFSTSASTTDPAVRVTGLKPGTVYFYSISAGKTVLASGTAVTS